MILAGSVLLMVWKHHLNERQGQTMKILIVEDEALIGMEIEYTVERLGHEVLGPVAELDKALSIAADPTIGCAILDINIRGGNSYPVADLLLDRSLPVLLLTGYGAQTLPERLRGQARLSKPFTGDQLENEIGILCTRASNMAALKAERKADASSK